MIMVRGLVMWGTFMTDDTLTLYVSDTKDDTSVYVWCRVSNECMNE